MGVRGYLKGPRGDLIVCLPLDGGGLGGGDMSVSLLVPPTLSLPHKGGDCGRGRYADPGEPCGVPYAGERGWG